VSTQAAAAALGQQGKPPCHQLKGYPQGQAFFAWGPGAGDGVTPLGAGWAFDPTHKSSGKNVPKGDTTTTVGGHYAIIARPANEGEALFIAYGSYTVTVACDLSFSASVQNRRVTMFARAVIDGLNAHHFG
jgi:hypothetical protein